MCPAAAPAALSPCASVAPGRERGGVLGRARELDADRVVRLLAHDARAREHSARARARAPRSLAGSDQRRAGAHHLLRVGGAADARHPSGRRTWRSGRPSAARPAAGPGPWPPTRSRRAARDRRRRARRSARRARARARRGTRSRRAPRRPRPARYAAGQAARRRAGKPRSRAPARRGAACSGVRVCSVVRRPARASSTASAVPNEPAPITVARRAPGVGSAARARQRGRRRARSRLGLGHG